ncbi:MAG: CoA pyrophosphatase [Desulfuromonadales bacterium]|nr:CoA pyrophosphatase [Desulfuromonadales bacterium]
MAITPDTFFTLEHLRSALASYQPHLTERSAWPGHTHAAVALLLREGRRGVEILFILRAEFHGDPWSGNIAFPGGHIEADDESVRAAAERETLEEIGIDLRQEEFLGRIDDVGGAHLPVIVSCFSYHVAASTPLSPNREINEIFWVPLADLADPDRQRLHYVIFRGEQLERPAIDLLGPGRTVLWGITYRLVSHFMQLTGVPLPPTPIP